MNEAYIRSLHLKNFRCFSASKFDFNAPIVLIEGANGSGKTSLLEALHYASYMRSFRAHNPRDLIQTGSEGFYVSAVFDEHTVNVGVAQVTPTTTKRQIKVDQTTVTSYKELREFSRVITTTEDDLQLIKGGPEKRRSFIDHALFLAESQSLDVFKLYQEVLDNRNALLSQDQYPQEEQLAFWTHKLWDLSLIIQQRRADLLKNLTNRAIQFLEQFWPEYELICIYRAKEGLIIGESYEDFENKHAGLFEKEKRYQRSLFGSHLDDIEIMFGSKNARFYSSRGQQKLVVILLKLALVEYLLTTQGKTAFLLDDFTTDFDANAIFKLMSLLLRSKAQLIFVSPIVNGQESNFLKEYGIFSLKISI